MLDYIGGFINVLLLGVIAGSLPAIVLASIAHIRGYFFPKYFGLSVLISSIAFAVPFYINGNALVIVISVGLSVAFQIWDLKTRLPKKIFKYVRQTEDR